MLNSKAQQQLEKLVEAFEAGKLEVLLFIWEGLSYASTYLQGKPLYQIRAFVVVGICLMIQVGPFLLGTAYLCSKSILSAIQGSFFGFSWDTL